MWYTTQSTTSELSEALLLAENSISYPNILFVFTGKKGLSVFSTEIAM
jgi:hypothetical protein